MMKRATAASGNREIQLGTPKYIDLGEPLHEEVADAIKIMPKADNTEEAEFVFFDRAEKVIVGRSLIILLRGGKSNRLGSYCISLASVLHMLLILIIHFHVYVGCNFGTDESFTSHPVVQSTSNKCCKRDSIFYDPLLQ